MSHVDEGTLHAWLDGALDAVLTPGEAERVRRHLAVCDVCAARLEEERAARDEAATLLGLAALPVVDPPAFEGCATRPGRGAGPGEERPLWKLGWAASVVLAAGCGMDAAGRVGALGGAGARGAHARRRPAR